MPKFINEPKKDVNEIFLPPKNCVLVAVPKGLEIFLSIASYQKKINI